MKFTQIRHGSHVIEFKGRKFLVDPVFDGKHTSNPLPLGKVKEKNPLVEMPFDTSFAKDIDGIIITHMHFDHFDQAAMDQLDKGIAIYCHEADVEKIEEQKFTNVNGFDGTIVIDGGLSLTTINGGQHGRGIRGKLMGRTTGYVLKDLADSDKEKTVFLVGDSLWCQAVEDGIKKHQPQVIIAFAGEARLLGKKITMSTDDLHELATHSGSAKIIVNHMDTWNHCYLTRPLLKAFLKNKNYKKRFYIPNDGESIDGV